SGSGGSAGSTGGGVSTGAAAGQGGAAAAGSGATAGNSGSAGSAASGGTGGASGASGAGGGGAGSGGAGAGGTSSGGTGGGAGTPKPQGVGGAWSLVFQDEFDGSSLDFTKWRPSWFGATNTTVTKPVNDLEVSCYDPTQVKVGGGELSLTAIATTQAGCVKKDGGAASYKSGLIMSDGRYNFTYGFVEARIWLPPGTGSAQNWAAFWVNGKTWPQDGEIDIMETLGGGAATRWTYHYDSDTGGGSTHSQITASPQNLISASGWHVFGANWQPDKITFYYDGKDVGSVSSGDLQGGAKTASSPHYIIINLGLNGNYPVKVPSTLKVDYVRHWQ
ncbi:MAG TPA: glycoside hydrolase family 16 protein, partial [Polyangiaceae bacterium]|nr:glycoside hydrolase family 16 protein [Polyangiaceae bacterium]